MVKLVLNVCQLGNKIDKMIYFVDYYFRLIGLYYIFVWDLFDIVVSLLG